MQDGGQDSSKYDVIIANGTLIDPAAKRNGRFDIAISDGKVAAVEADLSARASQRTNRRTDRVVIPGMIDTHAHVYQYVTGKFGLSADMVGVQSGVTTIIDQGGPSCMTIGGFRHYVAEPAKSRALCFISCYLVGGLEGHLYPDLYGPGGVNKDHTIKVALDNLDLVRGIKAHAEIGGQSRWGLDVIKIGKEISRATKLPLYIHLGQLWPTADSAPIPDADELIRELTPLMEPGDILAHPFTRHPGGFVSSKGEVHPILLEAVHNRGVRVDVGHGSHFSFEVARIALDAGILPLHLAPTCTATTSRCRAASGRGPRRKPVLRRRPVQPDDRDDRIAASRCRARRYHRDGDVEPGNDARHVRRDRLTSGWQTCRRQRPRDR